MSHPRVDTPVAGPEDTALPIPALSAGGYAIAVGASSVQSAVLPVGVWLLSSDVSVFVAQGANPVADKVGAAERLPGPCARVAYHIEENERLAVLADSTAGTVWLTPCRMVTA